jgi:hypothetical protein
MNITATTVTRTRTRRAIHTVRRIWAETEHAQRLLLDPRG